MNTLRQVSNKNSINNSAAYESLSRQIFRLCFIILLIIDCVENTSVIYSHAAWMKEMYLIRNILYLVLFANAVFLSDYTKKELTIAGVCFLTFAFGYLKSGDFTLMEFFIVAIAARQESPRNLVKTFLVIKSTAVIMTLLLWKIGILPTLYYQDARVGYYNTYGFCHRNVMGANVAIICLAWFYLRYGKLKMRDVLFWCGIGVITYQLAHSRTGLVIQIAVIFGVFLFQKMEKKLMNFSQMQKILLGGFLATVLLCVFCSIFYSADSAFWSFADNIFTKRFSFANLCLKEYGISLFGQHIPFVNSFEAQTTEVTKLILDNAYMRVLLYDGLVPGVLFLAIYYKALKYAFQKNDCALICGLVVLAVYGLSERYMLDAFYQFPLGIAFGECFFGKQMARKQRAKQEYGFPG